MISTRSSESRDRSTNSVFCREHVFKVNGCQLNAQQFSGGLDDGIIITAGHLRQHLHPDKDTVKGITGRPADNAKIGPIAVQDGPPPHCPGHPIA